MSRAPLGLACCAVQCCAGQSRSVGRRGSHTHGHTHAHDGYTLKSRASVLDKQWKAAKGDGVRRPGAAERLGGRGPLIREATHRGGERAVGGWRGDGGTAPPRAASRCAATLHDSASLALALAGRRCRRQDLGVALGGHAHPLLREGLQHALPGHAMECLGDVGPRLGARLEEAHAVFVSHGFAARMGNGLGCLVDLVSEQDLDAVGVGVLADGVHPVADVVERSLSSLASVVCKHDSVGARVVCLRNHVEALLPCSVPNVDADVAPLQLHVLGLVRHPSSGGDHGIEFSLCVALEERCLSHAAVAEHQELDQQAVFRRRVGRRASLGQHPRGRSVRPCSVELAQLLLHALVVIVGHSCERRAAPARSARAFQPALKRELRPLGHRLGPR
mmetsp:Transcript_10219/g.39755  ORF Transcript_10219/g.39755 Transcript_10219/m.39755 type:complete len:390 (-) Transcript_10219:243-1412(-)